MRRSVWMILVVALVAAACGGDDDTATTTTASPATSAATTTATPATTAPTTTAAPVTTTTTEPATTTTATEPASNDGAPLLIESVDFDEEFVVITNVSDAEYSLEGHFVCNFPNYASISDIGTVAAGESFTVPLADLGAVSSTGEVGIYTSSDFGSADAMVTYVEWGTPNHGRSSVAVEAGLWTAGDFVDNGRASFRALTTGGSGDDYELVE